MIDSSDFSTRLRDSRLVRGLTQAGLANRASLPASAISHFERGDRSPSLNSFTRLCDALQVSADYLLGLGDHGALLDELTQADLDLQRAFSEMLVRRRREKRNGDWTTIAEDVDSYAREEA